MFNRLVKFERPSLQQQQAAFAMSREEFRQSFVREYVMNVLSGSGAATSFQLRTIRDNANEMFELMYPA